MSAAPPEFQRKKSPSRKASVSPSSPGSVDAWLDMLVSMLALPKPERQRVRDELEDHLRSRIDDLIITGLTEPEALQKAASELGETADLARQLTHAHAPPRKRTYAMHAALFALAGSITAVGILLSGNGSGPNTINGLPVVSSVPVIGIADDDHEPHGHDIRVNLRDTTLEAVIKAVTSAADRPVLVHWDVLQDTGIERDEIINFDVEPLPHHLVHGLLVEHFARIMHGDTLAWYESDGLYEISARSHFDKRTTERVMYSLDGVIDDNPVAFAGGPTPIGAEDDAIQIVVDIIQANIDRDGWVDLGGATSSVTSMERTLIISAPKRVHQQIKPLLDELRERRAVRSNGLTASRERLAALVRFEYQELLNRRENIVHGQQSGIALEQIEAKTDESLSERERLQVVEMLNIRLNQLAFEQEEIDARISFLRDKMLRADYAWIIEAIPESPARGGGRGGSAPF